MASSLSVKFKFLIIAIFGLFLVGVTQAADNKRASEYTPQERYDVAQEILGHTRDGKIIDPWKLLKLDRSKKYAQSELKKSYRKRTQIIHQDRNAEVFNDHPEWEGPFTKATGFLTMAAADIERFQDGKKMENSIGPQSRTGRDPFGADSPFNSANNPFANINDIFDFVYDDLFRNGRPRGPKRPNYTAFINATNTMRVHEDSFDPFAGPFREYNSKTKNESWSEMLPRVLLLEWGLIKDYGSLGDTYDLSDIFIIADATGNKLVKKALEDWFKRMNELRFEVAQNVQTMNELTDLAVMGGKAILLSQFLKAAEAEIPEIQRNYNAEDYSSYVQGIESVRLNLLRIVLNLISRQLKTAKPYDFVNFNAFMYRSLHNLNLKPEEYQAHMDRVEKAMRDLKRRSQLRNIFSLRTLGNAWKYKFVTITVTLGLTDLIGTSMFFGSWPNSSMLASVATSGVIPALVSTAVLGSVYSAEFTLNPGRFSELVHNLKLSFSRFFKKEEHEISVSAFKYNLETSLHAHCDEILRSK